MKLIVHNRPAHAWTGGREPIADQTWLVLLHGAQNDHSVWALQGRWFAHHGWNVLALDLPGHGRSEGPPPDTIEGYADWVAAALEAANIDRAAVAGHSMGSLIALELAGRDMSPVDHLILIGTAYPMVVSEHLLQAARERLPEAIDMITAWSHSGWGQKPQAPAPGSFLNWAARRLMQRVAARHGSEILANDFAACNAYQGGLEAAGRVRCPSSLILGGRDIMTPPSRARDLANTLPASRQVVIAQAGHSLMTETPDAVLDALRDSLIQTEPRRRLT
jgi:pimeloyl-ACP methyl ester carboxylesterase